MGTFFLSGMALQEELSDLIEEGVKVYRSIYRSRNRHWGCDTGGTGAGGLSTEA
jgi:hypothetical protein